nr:hypothetical protein [Nitrosomonas ureae]
MKISVLKDYWQANLRVRVKYPPKNGWKTDHPARDKLSFAVNLFTAPDSATRYVRM